MDTYVPEHNVLCEGCHQVYHVCAVVTSTLFHVATYLTIALARYETDGGRNAWDSDDFMGSETLDSSTPDGPRKIVFDKSGHYILKVKLSRTKPSFIEDEASSRVPIAFMKDAADKSNWLSYGDICALAGDYVSRVT